MKQPSILIQNGTIITFDEPMRVINDHALSIVNGKIEHILPQKKLKNNYDKIIDASGQLVMPGFINAHMHFYSTLVRGLGKAEASADFVEVLKNLWWRLDKKLTMDDVYYSALIMGIEAIRHGCTTLIDHHASPGAVTGSLATIAKAVSTCGLKASLCYEVSDRDGEKVARAGLEENAEFITQCRESGDDSIKGLFGLHASFTISDKTLEQAAQMGHDLKTGFHVHTAEAKSDQDHCLEEHGMRVVKRFHKHGILGPQSIAAHCVHVDESEMALLAKTGTAVVHNPQSNLNNAVGIADIISLSSKGVLTGLGTDAMTVNMLEELRSALWAQHHRQQNPSVGFMEAAGMLFSGNRQIAQRYWTGPLGVLSPGATADVVLMDYHAPTPLNEETVMGHMIFGVSQSSVRSTISNGRLLMHDRQLLIDIDEAGVYAKARETAKKLWHRF